MFLFKKKTLTSLDFFQGFTDYHCHLLPGVDDGVQSMEETLEILSLYEQWGVKGVWFTPHIMEDVPNEPARLQERFEEVKAAYNGPLQLHLAAENMIDSLFTERLKEQKLLPLGEKGDHLLVETSYFTPPMDLYGIIGKVLALGLFPVLAHPERYVYMEPEDYERLKEMQVRFQLNLGSTAGMYGKHVQKKAEWLLKRQMYDLAGTDTHSAPFIKHAAQAKINCKTENLIPLKSVQL